MLGTALDELAEHSERATLEDFHRVFDALHRMDKLESSVPGIGANGPADEHQEGGAPTWEEMIQAGEQPGAKA